MTTYRVVAGPLFARSHLALANRYARLEDAVADMGQGVVVACGECEQGAEVVAFHQRHLELMQRLAR